MERDIESIVTMKAKCFVSLNYGDIQLLDFKNFLGGVTSLDPFLKAHKTNVTKTFLCCE